MQAYVSNPDGISRAHAEPFQSLTQVCYAPQDLASINSSPTPGPRSDRHHALALEQLGDRTGRRHAEQGRRGELRSSVLEHPTVA